MMRSQEIPWGRPHTTTLPQGGVRYRYLLWYAYRIVMISIKWSETAQKNALASADVIVTQLLRY